ncbi:MAG: sigma-54 interaction domain-containing protein [Bacillota bacterium]
MKRMDNSAYLLRHFTDMMSEGFIFIDNQGKIQIYNQKAKEIFGIVFNDGIGHEEGKIEKGDIVIIADNDLGKDDGGLNYDSLKVIGIHDDQIAQGHALLAIGKYLEPSVKPIYKHVPKDAELNEYKLEAEYNGVRISIEINKRTNSIGIVVGKQVFEIEFLHAFGHMVVLDEKTNHVKFYQEIGYTARGESIADLLTGKHYRPKGKGVEELKVVGKNLFDIHDTGVTMQEFYQSASDKEIKYEDKFREINGRATLCTLLPIDIEGRRIGAVLKVEDISKLKKIIKERDEALRSLESAEQRLKAKELTKNAFPEIIGESRQLNYLRNLLYKASKSKSTVLLLGETGTGKTLFAKSIHDASSMKNHPFVHVNCAAIPESLMESELFGYEKGAFTGAQKQGKLGLFEAANRGTIFLDEIGELSVNLQSKLLQVIQTKSFYRLGGTQKVDVDIRIITATNKNLEDEMMKGRFREDLYYRINVLPIWIPPLRERKDDIIDLVYYFLPIISKNLNYETKTISGEAMKLIMNYEWPGNIRELENVLERAVNLAEGNTVLSNHIIFDKKGINETEEVKLSSLKKILEEAEKKAIQNALIQCSGDKKEAMRILKVGKTSFYDKIKKYDLDSSE